MYSPSAGAILTHLVPESQHYIVCLNCFSGVLAAAAAGLLLSRREVGKLAGDREGEISSRHAGKQSLPLPLFPSIIFCTIL